MTHSNQPEYYTITQTCPYNGCTLVLGIFEDMDAVSYRLKRMYTTCGDEYRIECFHLSLADDEAKAYNEQLISRRKYQKEQEVKDRLYSAFKKDSKEPVDETAGVAN